MGSDEMKTKLTFAVVAVLGVLFSTAVRSEQENKDSFTLSSATFKNNAFMPAELAREAVKGGKNISPELQWKNIPAGTKSFALICIDMHPVAKRWIHWMVINIPATVNSLPLNASLAKMPAGCVELANSFGDEGWGGPQPPKGTGVHKYVIGIYALNVEKLDGKPANEKEFLQAIKGKVIAKAVISGLLKQYIE